MITSIGVKVDARGHIYSNLIKTQNESQKCPRVPTFTSIIPSVFCSLWNRNWFTDLRFWFINLITLCVCETHTYLLCISKNDHRLSTKIVILRVVRPFLTEMRLTSAKSAQNKLFSAQKRPKNQRLTGLFYGVVLNCTVTRASMVRN